MNPINPSFPKILRAALLACLCWLPGSSFALELSGIFTDHMVMQRQMKVPVWGWAEAGEEVSVSIDKQTKTATADAKGKWRVDLDPMELGAPRKMVVKGKTAALEIADILLGEVWLCSGQSNMEWYLSNSKDGKAEVAAANFPEIRLFNMCKDGGSVRAKDGPAERLPVYTENLKLPKESWEPCSPETAGNKFSGVAYFFARHLQADLHVPIGLISNSVGGTAVESWISRAAYEADPDYKAVPKFYDRQVEYAKTPAGQAQAVKFSAEYEARQVELKEKKQWALWPTHYEVPSAKDEFTSVWFNTRVNPLIPFAMRGVIWYQGEGNGYRKDGPNYPCEYRGMFPLMIKDWRSRWGEGDFPFLFVQLPFWAKPTADPASGGGWAQVREAQLMTLKLPKTGMAVAIDLGDPDAIHPINKQPVGERLSLAARGIVYGEKIVYSGPIYRGMKVEGAAVRLTFDHVGGGLVAKGGGELKQFAIAGADMKFVVATAVIDKDTVVVSSPDIPNPVAVRYAWQTNPEGCNLYNKEDLPASPFRTDEQPYQNGEYYKKKLAEAPTLQSKI